MKLAILDRIGALYAEGEDALVSPADWVAQPGVLAAIAQLNRAGWQVTVATNQPGLGRGSFDVTELNALHARMQRDAAAMGARVDAVFFCPHAADEGCPCRKPAPGLLQQIAARYGAEPHEVWVIGQEACHLQAGEAMDAHLVWLGIDSAAVPEGLQQAARYQSWQAMADALAPDAQLPLPPTPLSATTQSATDF